MPTSWKPAASRIRAKVWTSSTIRRSAPPTWEPTRHQQTRNRRRHKVMTSQKAFASTGDLTEKKVSFTEVGPDLFAYTAEGDPNTGVIVGDDCCAVFDAQATPAMARQVVEKVRAVTDKPIKYVILSHYHAVRVLGASAYQAQGIIASQETHR